MFIIHYLKVNILQYSFIILINNQIIHLIIVLYGNLLHLYHLLLFFLIMSNHFVFNNINYLIKLIINQFLITKIINHSLFINYFDLFIMR